MTSYKPVHIIGAGLAGSEAAWQIAQAGIPVIIHEMRGVVKTDAHQTTDCAELVCSNSFRSHDDEYNAVGLLHWEMRQFNSIIMNAGEKHKVPAGGALAVDRDAFAAEVTKILTEHPLITITREEITDLPPEEWGPTLIATGPLTGSSLAAAIQKVTDEDALAFFDAVAPIIYKESIDFDIAWYQSRYDKEGTGGEGAGGSGKDYINCPMNKEEYLAFIEELKAAPKTEFKEWEKDTPYFDGCMPIEVMAERGIDTPRFGPMKPVGLDDPRTGRWPYAVVQLRQDNALGTLYNMVGFQTKMKYAEQARVFRLIPGLQNAEFARLGGLHRNTFINSPRVLDGQFRLKARPHIRFAGQITGCEGYVESASIGMLTGQMIAAEIQGREFTVPPATTALGALSGHITGGAHADTFQPMNVNFGLFPEPTLPEGVKKVKGRDRKKLYTDRAKRDFSVWVDAHHIKGKAA